MRARGHGSGRRAVTILVAVVALGVTVSMPASARPAQDTKARASTARAAAATAPGADTTALYADVLSDAAMHDVQFAYDLGWQATAVQETGYAVVAAQNEARAEYVRAAEAAQHQEAVDAYLRARAASRGQSSGRSSSGSSSGSGSRSGSVEEFLACTRNIESHGNYGALSPGGKYRGAYQFDQTTWDSNAAASGRQDLVGRDPASAGSGDQDQMARDLYARRGNQPWGGRC